MGRCWTQCFFFPLIIFDIHVCMYIYWRSQLIQQQHVASFVIIKKYPGAFCLFYAHVIKADKERHLGMRNVITETLNASRQWQRKSQDKLDLTAPTRIHRAPLLKASQMSESHCLSPLGLHHLTVRLLLRQIGRVRVAHLLPARDLIWCRSCKYHLGAHWSAHSLAASQLMQHTINQLRDRRARLNSYPASKWVLMASGRMQSTSKHSRAQMRRQIMCFVR